MSAIFKPPDKSNQEAELILAVITESLLAIPSPILLGSPILTLLPELL